eukprot:499888-Prymnesium_polylepis.2
MSGVQSAEPEAVRTSCVNVATDFICITQSGVPRECSAPFVCATDWSANTWRGFCGVHAAGLRCGAAGARGHLAHGARPSCNVLRQAPGSWHRPAGGHPASTIVDGLDR